MRTLYTIGEVAGMFRVSMGTLRHYEQAGLLQPEYTDPETGYRYYGVRQFEVLNTIRYLRVLEFSLPQIREFLQNRDAAVMEEKLLQQQSLIAEKKRELEKIEKKIRHRLESLQDARSAVLDEIFLCNRKQKRMAVMEDSLHPGTYLDLELPIRKLVENQKDSLVFLGKIGVGISLASLETGKYDVYDLVFLLLDEEDTYEGEIIRLPAGEYVTVRFCGGHREAPGYYQKLLDFCREQGLEMAGFSQEITLIDDGMTKDATQFVTEISIPVKKSKL